MKLPDLESQIKSVRVPERDAEFWQTLPHRVLAKAQAAPKATPRASAMPFAFCLLPYSKFVLAILVLGFCLWQTRMPQAVSNAVLKDGRQMRLALARVHDGLDTLMRDEHGLHNLIQDPP
jgi:hypothetical protein